MIAFNAKMSVNRGLYNSIKSPALFFRLREDIDETTESERSGSTPGLNRVMKYAQAYPQTKTMSP